MGSELSEMTNSGVTTTTKHDGSSYHGPGPETGRRAEEGVDLGSGVSVTVTQGHQTGRASVRGCGRGRVRCGGSSGARVLWSFWGQWTLDESKPARGRAHTPPTDGEGGRARSEAGPETREQAAHVAGTRSGSSSQHHACGPPDPDPASSPIPNVASTYGPSPLDRRPGNRTHTASPLHV